MENNQNSILETDNVIPVCKCPYNKSKIIQASRIIVMFLGTIGISYLNYWVAGVYWVYSLVFNYLVWPINHCKNCYYKVINNSTDKINGKPIKSLLSVQEWKIKFLHKHVECGKKYEGNLFVLWFGPIILIIISFFVNFNLIALLSLLGVIGSLGGMGVYMKNKICETCAIKDECFSSF